MADLLLLARGDRHRVRAFRRVAKALEMLPEPAERLLRRNELHRVRSIGEGSLHRIKQILRTGSCDDHRRLKAELPPGLRELLQLRGLGPSKIRLLHQHLGVASVAELERAARTGRIQRLPRMGERTTERVLQAIADHRRHIQRLPLHRALKVGRAVRQHMQSSASVQRVSLVGSLRRRRETIGDIDLLAASDDFVATISHFCTFADFAEIIARGTSIASARLGSGQQVDIWLVTDECFGAGLHAYSGSQTHVVALRDRANRAGLHISEHGVFRRADGHCLSTGRSEEEIFRAVNLPFIPPELREHGGEIEAAAAGRLPELIAERDLRGDLHMHTVASDGTATARRMAEAAAERGLEYVAITDHSKALTVANGLDETRLREQMKHLTALERRVEGVRVLRGVEVDILPDGRLDLDLALLRELDWVVASVHSDLGLDGQQMTGRLLRAIDSGVVDCIGHPTGRRLGRRDGYPLDLDRVLRAAARAGVAVEVNANPGRLDLDSVRARQARDSGAPIAINTDAHSVGELDNAELGVAVARRGWLEAKHVVNALSAEQLLDRRRQRLRREGALVVSAGIPAGHAEPAVSGQPSGLPEPPEPRRRELRERLERGDIDDPLRTRLEVFLRGEAEDELAEALAALSDNPLQLAFDLLLRYQLADE